MGLTSIIMIAAAVASPQQPQPQRVHSVHLTFSHHLDVGLDLPLKLTANCVGFATTIVQRYFDVFIPRAIRLADEMRARESGDRFKYQIHPWIGSLYTECVPWSVHDGCPSNPATIRCPNASDVQIGRLLFDLGPNMKLFCANLA